MRGLFDYEEKKPKLILFRFAAMVHLIALKMTL